MAVVLSGALVLPCRVQAEPVSATPINSDAAADPLRVEVASTIPDAELFPTWIRDRNPTLADQISVAHGHEQLVAVEIEGATYEYRVRIVATRDGVPVGVVSDWTLCECNSGQLLALIDKGIATAVEQLDELPAENTELEPKPEPEPPTEIAVEPGEYVAPGPTNARHSRLGPLGYTGVALGVLGVGGLVAGISLATRPRAIRGDPGLIEEHSTKTPGTVVAVTGGALLAVSIPLLVIDVVVRRRRATAVQPMIGPRFVGISIDL